MLKNNFKSTQSPYLLDRVTIDEMVRRILRRKSLQRRALDFFKKSFAFLTFRR